MNCKITFIGLSLFWFTNLKAQNDWQGTEVNAIYHLYAIDAPTDQVVYAGGYGGTMVKSMDAGASWQNLSLGSSDWVSDMTFFDAQSGWICSQASSTLETGQLQKTTDGGQTWSTLQSAANYLFMDWVNPSIGYVAGWDGFIEKTTDGGINWTTLTVPTTSTIADIQFLDANTGYFITTGYKLYKTTDGGVNWQTYSHPYIESIFFLNASVGYCTTYYGKIGKTTDGGVTFTYQQSPYGFKINDIVFKDNSIGYAVGGLDCSSGNCLQSPILLTTTDGGNTWIDNDHPYVGMQRGFFQIDLTPNGQPFIAGSNKIILQQGTAASLFENQMDAHLLISPNPATTEIQLEVPDNAQITVITDLSGKKLLSYPVTSNSKAILTIESLSSGMYMITMLDQQNIAVATGKFLK